MPQTVHFGHSTPPTRPERANSGSPLPMTVFQLGCGLMLLGLAWLLQAAGRALLP